jgi:hypothetical protein
MALRRPTLPALRSALLPTLRAALLALGACNTTPTLPLPPPVVSAITAPDENGLVSVRGAALERAYVSILNNDTSEGVITQAADDGSFQATIAASAGDRLEVWQEQNGESGEHLDIGVPGR